MSLLGTIQHLSETIGPRGSTTEDEAKAAEYVVQEITALGLESHVETFLSATSAYTPYIAATGAALIGLFLFWQPQPVGAAAAFILTLVALASLFGELAFKDNPLRWIIATDTSQNVVARIPATANSANTDGASAMAHLPPVLITAHIDTHRTPLLFSSPGWRKLFHALMPIGLGCMVVLILIFAVGIVNNAALLRQLALVPGAVVLALFALFIQAARSPFTPGANDNASGAAVALDLVQRLHAQPLARRDAIVVFTGCEEVGAYGADAFIAKHTAELKNAVHMVIDHVGGVPNQVDGPCVIRSERFFRRFASDASLLRLAEKTIQDNPNLRAHTQDFDLAYSELSIGAKHGLRAIGLMGLTPANTLPNWHVPQDTLANVNEATVQNAADFAWQFLRAIDADADDGNADDGSANANAA